MKTALINTAAIEGIETARKAAYQLIEKSCQIIRVEIGDRRPVIWIKSDQHASELDDAVVIRRITMRSGKRMAEHIHAALVGNCQVQWREINQSRLEARA